jgi:choline dehydrogenase-like flavoprotein
MTGENCQTLSGYDRRDVDVVVVGSGPAGSTYARMISDRAPHATVLLVDAGPAITTPPGRHSSTIADAAERDGAKAMSQGPFLSDGQPGNAAAADQERPGLRGDGLFLLSDGNADIRDFPAASASSNVGGMGSHWACCCPRPSGTERIDCISTRDLDRAFLQAERLLDVSAARFDTAVNGYVRDTLGLIFDHGRATDLAVQSMPVAGSRSGDTPVLHGPGVILQDVFERPRTNATLLQNTRARRVLVEQGRAVGVELEDVTTGRAATMRARWVVVAADALRTPQLLFASGIKPRALGHHLNEHAMLAMMVELTGTDLEPTRSTKGGYALSNGPFASAGDGITWIPFTGNDFPCSVQILHINRETLPPSLHARTTGGPVIAAAAFVAKDVQWDDRVEFSDTELDWAGLPKMSFHYRLTALDERRIATAQSVVTKISDIGKPLFDEVMSMPAGSSLHYQGTYRLGSKNDGTNVCNPNSEVWDVANLFLAGNGLIPTETATNPTLTSVALATIGAEEIVRRLGDAPSR